MGGLLAAVTVAACAGARAPNDASAADIASADATLRSSAWVLESYQPEVPLEPLLGGLLALQVNALVVRFEGGRLRASSPSLHFDRAYRVTEAYGPRFTLVSPDDAGVSYASQCELMNDGRLRVHGSTDPWRGVGVLRRKGP